MVDDEHWQKWHQAYEDPTTPLSRRLAVVQGRISDTVDHAQAGAIRVVSMCAGSGRDLIGVLADHPRRADVTARLVELDPVLVAEARASVGRHGLTNVDVVEGDASNTSTYLGAVPADLLLVCGVFGNISHEDIQRTINEFPHLAAAGATVIWTRHPRPPDQTPTIRRWFTEAGFDEIGFDVGDDASFAVGTNRFDGTPRDFRPELGLFRFREDQFTRVEPVELPPAADS